MQEARAGGRLRAGPPGRPSKAGPGLSRRKTSEGLQIAALSFFFFFSSCLGGKKNSASSGGGCKKDAEF